MSQVCMWDLYFKQSLPYGSLCLARTLSRTHALSPYLARVFSFSRALSLSCSLSRSLLLSYARTHASQRGICICIYIYIYTDLNTHTHVHTHTHANTYTKGESACTPAPEHDVLAQEHATGRPLNLFKSQLYSHHV